MGIEGKVFKNHKGWGQMGKMDEGQWEIEASSYEMNKATGLKGTALGIQSVVLE